MASFAALNDAVLKGTAVTETALRDKFGAVLSRIIQDRTWEVSAAIYVYMDIWIYGCHESSRIGPGR